MINRPPGQPPPVEIRTNLVPASDFKQFGNIGRWLSLFREITAAITWPVGLGSDGNPHWIRTDATGKLQTTAAVSTALNTGQLNATTVAAQIIASNTARIGIVLFNNGPSVAYIGGSGVTTGNGQILPVSGTLSLTTQAALYAITASGIATVSYIEQV